MTIDCPRPVRTAVPLTSGAPPAMSHTPSSRRFCRRSDAYRFTPRRPASTGSTVVRLRLPRLRRRLGDGQRWSTWLDVEPLCRGPEPRPDWVVTSQGAIDTELGILKTGKEADVFLRRAGRPARARRRRS